jgi:hypothetical protein
MNNTIIMSLELWSVGACSLTGSEFSYSKTSLLIISSIRLNFIRINPSTSKSSIAEPVMWVEVNLKFSCW